MTELNRAGMIVSASSSVHAMTDVTGFGLLGHLIEMCEGSGVSARIRYTDIPLLPGIGKYMDQFIFPDNTYRNWNSFEQKVIGVNGPEFITLSDPQTSGGLLISVEHSSLDYLLEIPGLEELKKSFMVIGKMIPRENFTVEIIK